MKKQYLLITASLMVVIAIIAVIVLAVSCNKASNPDTPTDVSTTKTIATNEDGTPIESGNQTSETDESTLNSDVIISTDYTDESSDTSTSNSSTTSGTNSTTNGTTEGTTTQPTNGTTQPTTTTTTTQATNTPTTAPTSGTTQPTTAPTQPTATSTPTTAPTQAHTHSYTPTYGTTTVTVTVQDYASDGTTNDYSRPIYEMQTKYRDVPVYEKHQFDVNGRDVTVAWENGGRTEWQNSGMWDSNNSDSVNMKNWLEYNTGSRSTYSANVQVGTTTESYQEEVLVGYEQLGTTTQQVTKKTITGYTCSCGTTLSVSQYVNQYGTPSGYHMSNGILVED